MNGGFKIQNMGLGMWPLELSFNSVSRISAHFITYLKRIVCCITIMLIIKRRGWEVGFY
jgi:hypothetical protein